MNIYEAIDRYNINQQQLTSSMRYDISKTYDQDTWIRAVKLFVKGIGNQHLVPGNLVAVLYSMCSLHDDGICLTNKQMIYLSSIIVDHWQNVSYQIRSQLYI